MFNSDGELLEGNMAMVYTWDMPMSYLRQHVGNIPGGSDIAQYQMFPIMAYHNQIWVKYNDLTVHPALGILVHSWFITPQAAPRKEGSIYNSSITS